MIFWLIGYIFEVSLLKSCQLSPEQAALRLNNTTSAKGVSSLLTPGHESYPDKFSIDF